MSNRAAGILAGLFLAVAVAGCSSHEASPDQGEPALPASLPVVNLATFTLPLDVYRFTDEQSLASYNARNILLVRCMRRFGFTIVPPAAQQDDVGGLNERRYFLADDARAQAYGYKWPEITNQKRVPEPELSAAEQAAMSGKGPNLIAGVQVPPGGCVGEAARLLGVDAGAEAGLAMSRELTRDAHTRMEQDSRVLAATRGWSACMARSGYHYDKPAQANDDPAFATEVAGPAELATAKADVACKREAGLINIMAAVETAYQRRSMEHNQQRLEQYKDSVANQVRAAADVISGRR